jgi:3-hydroxybutyryl-CoA dehydratase
MQQLSFDSVQAGDELPAVERKVSQEIFWKNAVASFDYNPVHCDPEWVKQAQPFGIPVTVAHGMMTMSFMMTVVSNWAYPAMLKITKATSKFTRPVQGGWTIRCTGVISEKHLISHGKNYVVVDVKAENQDGDVVGICQMEVAFPE